MRWRTRRRTIHVVHHARPAGLGGPWYVRVIEEFSHFSQGWVRGTLGYLFGHLCLVVGLILAGMFAVFVGRVWVGTV